MIYRSNLTAPNLAPHFRLKSPPLLTMNHDMPSDPDHDPNCGYWTQDEAAILFSVAKLHQGEWLDIGARFGWTAAHLNAAGCKPYPIDPHFAVEGLRQRFNDNVGCQRNWLGSNGFAGTSEAYFEGLFAAGKFESFDGAIVDGNHDAPEPMHDAIGCREFGKPDLVVMFHDFWGQPIQDGVSLLMDRGFKTRIYNTPNGVACCWRGCEGFVPPDHVADPAINWTHVRKGRAPDFDFGRIV